MKILSLVLIVIASCAACSKATGQSAVSNDETAVADEKPASDSRPMLHKYQNENGAHIVCSLFHDRIEIKRDYHGLELSTETKKARFTKRFLNQFNAINTDQPAIDLHKLPYTLAPQIPKSHYWANLKGQSTYLGTVDEKGQFTRELESSLDGDTALALTQIIDMHCDR